MNRSSNTAGFTLVEILVVVMLLSFISLLAVPLLRKPPSQTRLKADVTRMAAALRVTRAAAMAQSRPMDFIIDRAKGTYRSPVIAAAALDPSMMIGVHSSAIRFFPSGQSTGGDIMLRLDHAEARVQVIWATGHVVVNH